MQDLGRFMLIMGLLLVLVGVLLLLAGKLGLGHLPGDIFIRRGSFRLYIPIASSILLSILLTVLFRILRK